MENKNYGEIFCQATEILAQHLIEQISFDRTILCTIVDDSEKNIGKYRVSNTDMTFDAYTSDTNYKINDNVYVSIPGGDWNEQKLIVSKKANDSETMVEYINPYDRFINITNNIIPTNSLTAGLVANDINKKQILLWSYNSNEDSTLKSGGEVYAGYTRLALSGSFQTLLKSFDVRFGDYGLNLIIKTAAADSDKTAIKVCNLNCADMTGNPYNYQGFFPQAKIFDISNINQVIEMELWFYQKAGSFKNAQGAAIPYENMSSNILVKDINVALGYDTQSFDKDTLILYTQDLTDYDVKKDDESNHKKLEVRWIHKFDETGKIKVVELNDGIDYNLTFYRHSLGESSHTVWSGVDWAFLSSQTVIEGEVSYKCADVARDPSYNTVWLKPDYNKAQERIKAILTYNNNEEVLFSSILTINNANEVISKETIDALSALNINCEDDSNGNYFLYRIDGQIISNAYSKIKRAFKLYFNAYGDTSSLLPDAESVEWIIPNKNTMINLYPEQGQIFEVSEDNGFYHVKTKEKIIDNTDPNIFNLYYTINSSHGQQNNNNTVKCVVVRNQIEYTAIKELSFGTAGTAGTDYTFVLDFADNKYNALTIVRENGEKEIIEVEATLYDYTGKKLDISGRTIEWSLTTDGNDDNVHSDDGYIVINDTDFNKAKLQFNSDKPLTEVPDDNYTILKAKLTNWGDFALEAYLPIPIRLSKDYQFISGTTTIVYNSLGNLDINTFQNPYIIYINDGAESISGNWSIKSGVVNDPCIPSLEITEDGTKLKPISIYVEDTMSKLCITGSIIDNEEKSIKVWSQPIYAYQNKYPTSIINDWNGELTIDNDKNSILAAKIVAGRKNTDNTFTGVMMGDWRGTGDIDTEAEITEHTGIYGFRNGAATFGFKDDGTAFIGEAGKGRLIFDGKESTIKSALMTQEKGGMLLDFDDSVIKLVQYDEEKKAAGENSILLDASDDSTLPIIVGKDKKFKVDWEGNVEAEGKITATSGKIGAWNVLSQATEYTLGEGMENPPEYLDKIPWPPPSDWPDIEYPTDENNQVIDMSGMLYAQNFYLLPDGRLRIGSINNPKFEVQPDGTLISKGGSITITDGDKTIFEANNDGFNLANGNFIYNKDEDTLRLKDVTFTWQDEQNNTVDLNEYLETLQNQTNNIQDQLDKRAQTWYQATDPSNDWEDDETKKLHLGDLWHYTGDTDKVNNVIRIKNSEWVWEKIGENYQWKSIEVSDEVFDKIDGVASIFTTIPDNPVVGDLLIPTEDIKDGDVIKYYAKKVYKYTYINEKFEWIEINYTDDTNLNNFIANEFDTVKKNGQLLIDELGFQKTEIGENYIISPSIGGGYLNIVGKKGSKVIIDPNGLTEEDYIFQVYNGEQISVGIKEDGSALFQGTIYATDGEFAGAVTATSLTLGDNVNIDYSKISNTPKIPTNISDLIGSNNIIMKDDISITTSENNGIITTTTIIGENEYTTVTSKESNYVLTNIGLGNPDDKYFCVSKDGLLTANNAIIHGTLYATGGEIGGCSINNNTLQIGWNNMSTETQTKVNNAERDASEANTTAGTVSSNLSKLVKGEYTGGTFIDGRKIISASFYATEGDLLTYSTMNTDGFYIYRGATEIPKLALTVSTDKTDDGITTYGKEVRIALGAGNDSNNSDNGKLILEKTVDDNNKECAKLFYTVNGTPYGFQFDANGVTMLGGGEFNVGTQAYAVFG